MWAQGLRLGLTDWKEAECHGGQQADHESSMNPYSNESPQHQDERCQQAEGGDPSSLLITRKTTSGMLGSVLGPQYKKDMDIQETVYRRAMKMIEGFIAVNLP